jgi:hypothetical protein
MVNFRNALTISSPLMEYSRTFGTSKAIFSNVLLLILEQDLRKQVVPVPESVYLGTAHEFNYVNLV